MPADFRPKTRAFEKNFQCLILERKDAIKYEERLDANILRCYTDGSKLSGRVGAGVHIEYPNNDKDSTQHSYYLGQLSTVFQAEVFAISMAAEMLSEENVQQQKIAVLSDSQAAIKAIESNTVTSNSVLRCIQNLNLIGKKNSLLIAWTPGHEGVRGNEEADQQAKRRSELVVEGPEPFIPVPYASCVYAIKDWSAKRWQTAWNERTDCRSTKEHVGWASNRLSSSLLSMSRSQVNLVLQILTGHCNLQKHKCTMGRATSPLCPKCGQDNETPDHHVGSCVYYRDIRKKYLGYETLTIRSVVEKRNLRTLASYLKQTGRLAEF